MHPEPLSTYRLQLRPGFGFDQATELVSYLKELGISHLYSSPYLQAATDSTHGYDVVDPTRVNEQLGGADAHARMCETIQQQGLGHVIDVVPNHMAIAGRQNPWWWDVLENGPSSRYATHFDVDWATSEERWPNKVLLPVLGDHYGRILESGELKLTHSDGLFTLHYYDHTYPVDPSSVAGLLGTAAEACGSDALAFLAESHARMPRPTVTAKREVELRHRDKAVLCNLMVRLCHEEPEALAAINAEVDRLNSDLDALDALIDQQNYRLAYWRTASRDLGYRRFFDITDLAGLRTERLEVFRAAHALPIHWVRKGWVQGLRVDHPDGLRDPAEYFRRLREVCPMTWILAEKILEPGETLPTDWPIEGTTGYDFLNLAGGLFVDPRGEEAHSRIYQEFTGEQSDFHAAVRIGKRLILTQLMVSELNRLTNLFVDVCERHRRHRDYTSHELREALCETAVCFPVYRSYVRASDNTVAAEDELYVEQAIQGAVAERPDMDPELFGFLKDLLLLRVPGPREGELAMRFQQLSGPAMAKGVEDTTFYRFNRLVALNEVGGDPSQFGLDLEQFHQACSRAQIERPKAMLASTTHDTKRSEDVRARLALLSEIPERWGETVNRWASYNARHKQGEFPDRNAEYLVYQTLVGAWPIDQPRMSAYMEKAMREAKTHTSWTQQNEAYEKSVQDFVETILTDREFSADLEGFVSELVEPGMITGMAQALIKLTAPGVPDIYQGTELWDFSLVDPDNRRPVDFDKRRQMLAELPRLTAEDIMDRLHDGLPKLWLTRQALHLRQQKPELFGSKSSYRALQAKGGKAQHLVAFVRGDAVITLAPRLLLGLGKDWADTSLELPAGRWHNLLTGEDFNGGKLPLKQLLSRFPLGLLVLKDQNND